MKGAFFIALAVAGNVFAQAPVSVPPPVVKPPGAPVEGGASAVSFGTAPIAPSPTPTPSASASASASVPVPVPVSVSATASALALPLPPAPGAWILTDWKAWYLGGSTELMVIRSIVHPKAMSVIDVPYSEPSLLRRYLTFSYKNFLQLGEQPLLELAADEACKQYRRAPDTFPRREMEEVVREFLGARGAEATLKHPDKNTPYFIGATLAAMEKPDKFPKADSPVKLTVTAAVVSCKEAAGMRFRLAQQRAFNTSVTNSVRALTWLIERWIMSKLAEAQTEPERDVLKAKSLGLSIKALRLSLRKMKEYQLWLAGPESKQFGGAVTWDAPLAPAAAAYARGLVALLEKQLSSLTREYESGRARNPDVFTKLEDSAELTNADLDLVIP